MAQLLGTASDDVLTSTAEDDAIWGGSGGTDTAVFSGNFTDYSISDNGDGSYYITDLRAGPNDGRDKVRSIEAFVFADRTVGLSTFLLEAQPTYSGTAGIDTLLGTSGDDRFMASAGDDVIWGGSGGTDTLIYSGNVADYSITLSDNGAYYVTYLRAGKPDGTDKVRAIEKFAFADGEVTLEEFVALSTDAPETITGTAGADTLNGGSGDDVFAPLAGQDRVWGGKDGFDTVILEGNFDDYLVTDNQTGALTLLDLRAEGDDGIKVIRDIDVFVFDDREIAVADIFSGTPTVQQVIAREIIGTNGDDELAEAHLGNVLDAYTNERIIGGGGADRINGGPGDDEIHGDNVDGVSIFENTPESDLPRFQLDDTFYQVLDGQIVRFDMETLRYETIGEPHDDFNAVGLNPKDGYAYGIGAEGEFEGNLLRFGSNGEVENLGGDFTGPGKNGAPKAGAFHKDGTYYLLCHANRLIGIDVATGNVTETILSGETPKVVDIAFIGDSAYGVGEKGELYQYNIETGDVTKIKTDGIVSKGAFESVWSNADGVLFAAQSKTGHVYQISDLGTEEPTLQVLVRADSSSASDGFSYGDAATAGEGGGDELLGGAGEDRLFGGEGEDTLDGGEGADQLDGGAGRDTADYSRAEAAVTASLATGGAEGDAAGDVYASVENLKGSLFGDTLIGDDACNYIDGFGGDDTINGGGGDDVIRGGLGADSLNGGDGYDSLSYLAAAEGVTLDLALGIGTGGEAAGDSFSHFEEILGSNHGDTIITSGWRNHISAGGGDDTIIASEGGDHLWGGAGNDIVRYNMDAFMFNFDRMEDPDKADNPLYEDGYFYTVTDMTTGESDYVRDVETLEFENGYFDTATGTLHTSGSVSVSIQVFVAPALEGADDFVM